MQQPHLLYKVLHLSRPLFVGSYLQVSVNEKEDKHALHQLMYVIVKVWYNFVNTIELCITKATLGNLLQSVVISPSSTSSVWSNHQTYWWYSGCDRQDWNVCWLGIIMIMISFFLMRRVKHKYRKLLQLNQVMVPWQQTRCLKGLEMMTFEIWPLWKGYM